MFICKNINVWRKKMYKIGVISDTHNTIDNEFLEFFKGVDEIWHAGDIGDASVLDELEGIAKVRAVYGNIDGHHIRSYIREVEIFTLEDMRVIMIHIAGSPSNYSKQVKKLIMNEKPSVLICGHSHILKVIYNHKYKLMHINPGAAGKMGFHKYRTALKFTIEGDQLSDLEVLELKR